MNNAVFPPALFVQDHTKKILTAAPNVLSKLFEDLKFLVLVTVEDYAATFQVYDLNEIEKLPDNTYLLPEEGPDDGDKPTYLNGFVKWDGCSNWMLDRQSDDCMFHACSREDLTRIGEVMARCWDWGKEIIPHWNR